MLEISRLIIPRRRRRGVCKLTSRQLQLVLPGLLDLLRMVILLLMRYAAVAA